MSDKIIICPSCRCEIPLDEALSHQLREEIGSEIRKEYEVRLSVETEKLGKQMAQKAAEKLELDIAQMKEELEEKRQKLDDARKQELELRKRQRELEDREAALALELQRKVDEARQQIIEDVQKKNAEQFELQIAEREKTISDMKAQIELLKKKAEQGSQQQQGEVLELKLEEMLAGLFPYDTIEGVQKGKRGGDVYQVVRDLAGKECGAILWEAKRAKSWSNGWVEKLKHDMADAGADLGIIVTTVLPEGVRRFGPYDGVWVSDIASAPGLAAALRLGLVEVARSKQAYVGKNEKIEYLYGYLQGTQFRQRIESTMEAFMYIREDIDSEKAAMARRWAKREKMLERAIGGMAGMYGDLQGIIGMSMPELESIEVKALKPADGPDSAE